MKANNSAPAAQAPQPETVRLLPRYPVYVPSRGRYESGYTPKFLIRDGVPFYLVVEPQEVDNYGSRYGYERLLVLPWSGNDATRQAFCAERGIENGGLIAVRNWIKEHAISLGAARHWQLDDNIRMVRRRVAEGRRIPCAAGAALRITEDFVDRYENVAIAGLQYTMFLPKGTNLPPFLVNHHVYSCSLILNRIPHRWRLAYNDDTDICLQVLADGWCTLLMQAFSIDKIRTMTVTGGNTTALYQGDGRLKMARALERMWPGVVTVDRRWQRPQHVVYDGWKRFDTPLKLKEGIDRAALTDQQYDLELVRAKPTVKSAELRQLLADEQRTRHAARVKQES